MTSPHTRQRRARIEQGTGEVEQVLAALHLRASTPAFAGALHHILLHGVGAILVPAQELPPISNLDDLAHALWPAWEISTIEDVFARDCLALTPWGARPPTDEDWEEALDSGSSVALWVPG